MKCKKYYKDIEKYRAYRNGAKRRYATKRRFNTGKRRLWTEEEIMIVMDHEMTDTEIAKKISRSVTAVQIKRNRMKGQKNEREEADAG